MKNIIKEKREMRNSLNIITRRHKGTEKNKISPSSFVSLCLGVRFFLILLSLISAILFLGCQNPFDLPQTGKSAGQGYFTLSIGEPGAGRTIMPEIVENGFAVYSLQFYGSGSTSVPPVERTSKDLSDPIMLTEGTWNLYVTAYMDEDKYQPAARGELTGIVISKDKPATGNVTLTPIDNGYSTGTFSWDIGYPSDVNSAVMTLTNFATGQTAGIIFLDGDLKKSSNDYPTGYYNVVIKLHTTEGKELERQEILHIYQYMESFFECIFTEDQFYFVLSGTVSINGAGATGEREVTVEMWDLYDTWNDSALRINVNGKDISSNVAPRSSYSPEYYTFMVNSGDTVEFYWISARYDYECAFAVYYSDDPPSPAFDPDSSNWSSADDPDEKVLLYMQYPAFGATITSDTLMGSFTAPGGTLEMGQILTANTDNLGGSGDNIIYQWKRGDTVIGTSDTYTVQSADLNYSITLTVARDGYVGSLTSAATVAVTDPTLPTLSGTVSISAGTGAPREVTVEMWDINDDGWDGGAALRINVNGSDTYLNARIERDGSPGYYTFTVNTGDTVELYWGKGTYDDECAFAVYYSDDPPSPAFDPNSYSWSKANDPDGKVLLYWQYSTMSNLYDGAPLGSFTAGGDPIVGQTLTVNTGNLSVSSGLSYQWNRVGTSGSTAISGANSNTYTLTNADRGYAITVTVRRDNYNGVITSVPTAIVTARKYTIYTDVSPQGAGYIYAYPSGKVEEGTNVTFSIVPFSDYEVVSFSVTDADKNDVSYTGNSGGGTGGAYSFTMPAFDVYIDAVFKEVQKYTIEVTQATGGQISTQPWGSAAANVTVRVYTSPSSGNELSSISVKDSTGKDVTLIPGEGSTGGADGNYYYFTMPALNVTVSGTFTPIPTGSGTEADPYRLSLNQWKTGNITSATREVWYQFTISASGVNQYHYVWLYDGVNDTYVDSRITLYNSGGYYSESNVNNSSAPYFPYSADTVKVKVTPISSSGNGIFDIAYNTSTTAPERPLAPPANIKAAFTSMNVTVSWDYIEAAKGGYAIYRSNTSNGTYTQIGKTSSSPYYSTYIDTGSVFGQTYYYKVSAINGSGAEGAQSSAVAATMPTITPINADTPVSGTITVQGQGNTGGSSMDWYSFTAVAQTTYYLTIDGEGTMVEYYTSGSTGESSSIRDTGSFTAWNGGTVYLKVSAYTSGASSSYNYTLTYSTTMPSPSATFSYSYDIYAAVADSENTGGQDANWSAWVNLNYAKVSTTAVYTGMNVSSWFNPTVAGLSYTVEVYNSGSSAESIGLKVTGTPTATSSASVTITIPANVLLDSNNNAITQALVVKGSLAYYVTQTPDYCLTVDGKSYRTISEAINSNSSSSSATITVTKSFELSGTVTIPYNYNGGQVTLVAAEDGLTISRATGFTRPFFDVQGSLYLGAYDSDTPKLIIDGKGQGTLITVYGNYTGGSSGNLLYFNNWGIELRNAEIGVHIGRQGEGRLGSPRFYMYGGAIAGCDIGLRAGSYSNVQMQSSGGIIYGADATSNANATSVQVDAGATDASVYLYPGTGGTTGINLPAGTTSTVQYGTAR